MEVFASWEFQVYVVQVLVELPLYIMEEALVILEELVEVTFHLQSHSLLIQTRGTLHHLFLFLFVIDRNLLYYCADLYVNPSGLAFNLFFDSIHPLPSLVFIELILALLIPDLHPDLNFSP